MKGRTIVLDHIQSREAAALMVDGVLEDFLIASDAPSPGTIYRARADRPVKGQGGMFLSTPDGPAFLRQVKGLAPGALLLVQVSGYAEPGKAIPVTSRILFKSRYAIVTPDAPGLNVSRSIRDEDERDRLLELAHDRMQDSPFGLILRSCCNGAEAEDIAQDIAEMRAQAEQVMSDTGTEPETLFDGDSPHVLAWRDWTDPAEIETQAGSFDTCGVLDALDNARTLSQPLQGGGHLYVQPTRALVAVDVNTGSDSSMAAGTRANFACAKALPRVLRVRGLGGQVTIDLAPMPKKERRGFEAALRGAFKNDPEETILAGWTPLGHFELLRKRGRIPLSEVLK